MKFLKWDNIVIIVVVIMLTYIGLSMVINAAGDAGQKLNKESPDPGFNAGLGNKMKLTRGDLSGMWSANVTGGFKMNYPWPLHDGPGASVSFGV